MYHAVTINISHDFSLAFFWKAEVKSLILPHVWIRIQITFIITLMRHFTILEQWERAKYTALLHSSTPYETVVIPDCPVYSQMLKLSQYKGGNGIE